ncbi:peptidoglycan-binding protein [Bacillus licheniformis]
MKKVKQFQLVHGLPANGIYGRRQRRILNRS